MSYYVHYFDISHCRRLFEALQCCTIAICCNFPHLRCEGDTRVVEEAIVLKGKVAPAEDKNKIIYKGKVSKNRFFTIFGALKHHEMARYDLPTYVLHVLGHF